MRTTNTGIFNDFEGFERAELLALDATYVNEMTDSYAEEDGCDGLRAMSYYDSDE